MRVLVTNDDGVGSPGLLALARALLEAGHEVSVVAPAADASGAAAALAVGPDLRVAISRSTAPSLPGVELVGVDGGPALAVLLARLGAFGEPPRMVVSGINAGANTGRGILHSGTVGAALTAATMNLSGLAVSVAATRPRHWSTAARVAVAGVDWLTRARRRTVLNVNVPDLPLTALRGVRRGRLAAWGAVRLVVDRVHADRVDLAEVAGTLPVDPHTDAGLVEDGFVSVTSVVGLTAATEDPAADGIGGLLRTAGLFTDATDPAPAVPGAAPASDDRSAVRRQPVPTVPGGDA